MAAGFAVTTQMPPPPLAPPPTLPPPSATTTRDLPYISAAEVSCHRSSASSLWVVVHNRVIDVTAFAAQHPGGSTALSKPGRAGCDVTSHFERIGHSSVAWAKLEHMQVGWLSSDGDHLGSDATSAEDHAVNWHGARRRAILHKHPEVQELMGHNPWTPLVGLATVLVHTYVCLLCGWHLGAAGTFAAAYTVGAYCKMVQFAVCHEVCHGTAGWLSKSYWARQLLIHIFTLPSFGGETQHYYGYQHLGHHASLGRLPQGTAIGPAARASVEDEGPVEPYTFAVGPLGIRLAVERRPARPQCLRIIEVKEGAQASGLGVRPSVIVSIGGHPATTLEEFDALTQRRPVTLELRPEKQQPTPAAPHATPDAPMFGLDDLDGDLPSPSSILLLIFGSGRRDGQAVNTPAGRPSTRAPYDAEMPPCPTDDASVGAEDTPLSLASAPARTTVPGGRGALSSTTTRTGRGSSAEATQRLLAAPGWSHRLHTTVQAAFDPSGCTLRVLTHTFVQLSHYLVLTLYQLSCALVLNPATIGVVVLGRALGMERAILSTFPLAQRAGVERKLPQARQWAAAMLGLGGHTWLWGTLVVVLWCNGMGWAGLFYLLLSDLFMHGFLLHPYAGYFLGVHRSELGRDATPEGRAACQPTMSTYHPFWSLVSLNLTYHVEHHDFPNVPWSRLPAVKALAPEFYESLTASPGFLTTISWWLRSGEEWTYACVP